MSKNEKERIAELRNRFAHTTHHEARGISVGVGDDAAAIELASVNEKSIVWTVDTQVEGTHFRLDWLDYRAIGFRSFMAATSDIAAMGARPLSALSALVLPPSVDDAAFTALTEGQQEAALLTNAQIIGGNLARGKELSITTTVLGSVDNPITRHGAKEGDVVWLGGHVGLAGAGLAALENNVQGDGDARIEECLAAWRAPRARIDLGMLLRMVSATSAIDVSDGLALDASRIADESYLTIVLSENALRAVFTESLCVCASLLKRDPLDFALFGGEDYALVATTTPGSTALPMNGFARIGTVRARGDHGPIILERADGSRAPLDVTRGFDHFRGPAT